ncbi:tRNA dimethylallyltransferase [Rhynchospora pubera]|uniref:tRNA dimethylallyltransferase n=1 Tax=Rhynchospora pubera TaxID=906938 RepID=A0AAV8E839_9POAL|nr:tRNA dimethylallyltransferase [Rhynchospora pubera]
MIVRMKLVSPLSPYLQTVSRHSRKSLATVSSLSSPEKQKVIVISGPTSVGKSRLALELAKRLNGEIICADSVTVYQGLDIGSAKPSLSERAEVTHHLLDILHPSEDYSAGDFYRDARAATDLVLHKGRVPIVTGGTGLYLRWFLYGKPGVPKARLDIVAAVWAEMEDFQRNGDWCEGVEHVVQAGDPSARTLPVNDWYRLRRKLEIIRSAGAPPSAFPIPYDELRNQDPSTDLEVKDLDYEFICIFLSMPRVELYRSIDLRCEEMVRNPDGLLSEASWLLDIGLRPDMNSATRAIGYRQAMIYLSNCRESGGKSSVEEFSDFLWTFQKASRNFAKRQIIWFRNEKTYMWIDASKNFDEIVEFVCDCYHGNVSREVPKDLEISRESGGKEEYKVMKMYQTQNKYFVKPENFESILDWIKTTQGNCATLVKV